jgi:PTH2 family peptidyl-tRNA hydrolase
MHKCPKCGSNDIDQWRMPTGEIWCMKCGYKVDHKELSNPFEYIEGIGEDNKLQSQAGACINLYPLENTTNEKINVNVIKDNTKKTKMVIVMRNDLNMRKGKCVSQGAHSALKLILDLMNKKYEVPFDDNDELDYLDEKRSYDLHFKKGDVLDNWLNGIFTKICVQVNSEQELLDIYNKAEVADLYTSLIEDCGLTEFKKECLFCGGNGVIWSESEARDIHGQEDVCPTCGGSGKISVPTITCCAILGWNEDVDKITGELKLL